MARRPSSARRSKKAPARKAKASRKVAARGRRKTASRKAKVSRSKARKSVKARQGRPRRARKAPATRKPARAARAPKVVPPQRPEKVAATHAHAPHPPTLSRERRRLPDDERTQREQPSIDSRLMAEARSGHDTIAASLRRHTESSPRLTAGDVDAKWEDAYAIGDEAPGGDNPTPDQNEVDAIGRALGAEYDDDEELMGGDEIGERDAHRWELDPKSREDQDED